MQGPQEQVHPPPQAGQPGAAFAQFVNSQAAKAQASGLPFAGWRPPGVPAWGQEAPRAPWPAWSGMTPYGPKWPAERGHMAKEAKPDKKGAKKVARPKAAASRHAGG